MCIRDRATLVRGPGIAFTRTYSYKGAQVLMPRAKITIAAGSEFILAGYDPSQIDSRRRYCGVVIDNANGNIRRQACLLYLPSADTLVTQFVGSSTANASEITSDYYEIREVAFASQAAYQRQIVYTGRSNNQIFITYREFQNDLARPAFTQELTFDINAGRVFGFKGARFEVEDATNTKIVYRLIRNFRSRTE